MIFAIVCCWIFLSTSKSDIFVLYNDPLRSILTSFDDAVSSFGPDVFRVDGYLVLSDPITACTDIKNTSTLFRLMSSASGMQVATRNFLPFIVLIQRGGCDFDLKVLHAQKANYSGVIVYNNVTGDYFPMSGRRYAPQIRIPSVMVDKRSGMTLSSKFLWSDHHETYLISLINYYNLPLKYVLICLLIMVGITLLVLIGCFFIHMCNLWRRFTHSRLSPRFLRQLATKRYVKDEDPYDTCPICLEDYQERDKLRLLTCNHAFHTKCIDPWLLRNRRRCPVCNGQVIFSNERDTSQQHGENVPQTAIGSFERVHRFFRARNRSVNLHATSNRSSRSDLTDAENAPLLTDDLSASNDTLVGSINLQVHLNNDADDRAHVAEIPISTDVPMLNCSPLIDNHAVESTMVSDLLTDDSSNVSFHSLDGSTASDDQQLIITDVGSAKP